MAFHGTCPETNTDYRFGPECFRTRKISLFFHPQEYFLVYSRIVILCRRHYTNLIVVLCNIINVLLQTLDWTKTIRCCFAAAKDNRPRYIMSIVEDFKKKVARVRFVFIQFENNSWGIRRVGATSKSQRYRQRSYAAVVARVQREFETSLHGLLHLSEDVC